MFGVLCCCFLVLLGAAVWYDWPGVVVWYLRVCFFVVLLFCGVAKCCCVFLFVWCCSSVLLSVCMFGVVLLFLRCLLVLLLWYGWPGVVA